MQRVPVKEVKLESYVGNVPDSLLAVPMVRCPNCGQKTSGDHCQCCKYPILNSRPTRLEETLKRQRMKAERRAKEQAKQDAEEARKAKKAAELYEGMVKLAMVSPVDVRQMTNLQEYLCQVQDLRLVWYGSSVEEGAVIVVSAEKPIPLIDVLREMPPVEQVVKNGKKILVMLKAE